MSVLRRGGARGLMGSCEGGRSRAAHVDDAHWSAEGADWSVEGTEKACADVTACPVPDTAEGPEQTTARRGEAAAGFNLTAREYQRATPGTEVTAALARPDNASNPGSQHSKTGSQHPKTISQRGPARVATPDRERTASLKWLAAPRSDLAAKKPHRTARAENVATPGNLLATSNTGRTPTLQSPFCVHFCTPPRRAP